MGSEQNDAVRLMDQPNEVLMPLSPKTTARIADLSLYGAGGYYFFGLEFGGALVGALVGLLVQRPGDGAVVGGIVGLATWVVLLVTSRRRLGRYVGRRRDQNGQGTG